jgi:hypothetical protein
MNWVVSHYSSLVNQNLIADNELIEQFESIDFETNALYVYKKLHIDYPKFYKMDAPSKLGFLTSEVLFKKNDFLTNYKEEEVGIVLYSTQGSLDTDKKFQDTIKTPTDFYPSPAIFVYTLANIVLGEICIRNKIKGENYSFVTEQFDTQEAINFVQTLMVRKQLSVCLLLWVNYIDAQNYACHSVTIENKLQAPKIVGLNLDFNSTSIDKIIQ